MFEPLRSVGQQEMEHHKYFFKNSRHNFPERARSRRSEAICKTRMDNRMNIFDSRRRIDEVNQVHAVVKEQKTISHKAEMLAKWKAEKQKLMAELKKKQKPVFKVGIMQRKATGSPILNMTNSYANKNFLKPSQLSRVKKVLKVNPGGVVTRAKSKAHASQNIANTNKTSISEVVNNQMKKITNHVFTVPESVSAIALKLAPLQPIAGMKQKNMIKHPENSKEEQENKENELKTIPKQIESLKSEPTNDFVPIYYSPFVTKSRGSEIRSPRKGKISLKLDVDKLIEKEENEFKCRLFSFRKYIECETKKLMDSCTFWKTVAEENSNIPEEIQEEILSLQGKTSLLTTDKFKQFKDLIDKCENKDPMIKLDDLQGYQDWVAIEVESLDQAFLKLEERRANNWKADENKLVENAKGKKTKPVPIKKGVKHTGKRSKIREHIEAARKLKQNATDIGLFNQLETWAEGKTPKKQSSLLKDVLNSETEKINNSLRKNRMRNDGEDIWESPKRFSGLEILVATQMAKSLTPGKPLVEKVLEEQLPQTDEIETPLKGILKRTPNSVNTSKHTVQFRLKETSGSTGRCLSERYFNPIIDEEDCCDLSIRMGDFTLQSPNNGRNKNATSTPIRRSARLAMK